MVSREPPDTALRFLLRSLDPRSGRAGRATRPARRTPTRRTRTSTHHMSHCVVEAARQGREAEAEAGAIKLAEVSDAIARLVRS